MVKMHGGLTEKVTFNMPKELKEQVTALKEEMRVSFSTIYNEAIAQYLRQKELEKWENGASAAMKDKSYREFSETVDDDGGLYDYSTR